MLGALYSKFYRNNIFLFAHADSSHMCIAIIHICDSVCLSVHQLGSGTEHVSGAGAVEISAHCSRLFL